MRKLKNIFLLCLVFALIECDSKVQTKKDENPAVTIIRNSIIAHGGYDLWIQMEELDYDKSIIMYDSSGEVESKIIQIHNYRFKPEFGGNITWSTDHIYRITYDDVGALKIVDNVPQLDSASIFEASVTYLSSHYVLFQPWRLFDPGANLRYVGKDQLDDITVVDVVKVTFNIGVEPGAEHDIWWFYFDEETSLLSGYLVDHQGRISYIRNESYDSTMDLVFPHHRYSHFVTDTARNNPLLRAEYFYDNFAVR
jgi:hypothetical protein